MNFAGTGVDVEVMEDGNPQYDVDRPGPDRQIVSRTGHELDGAAQPVDGQPPDGHPN
jgi:hypothetical protein